ncbi:hypothetical protein [Streptomyces neyagawaensis]|uniref:hypothetical protein n=1 Tax=Streptomyces neyagawaensis TaxID=42238 RepID=UPI0006E3FA98|nr:hypothetical protein [Streptomyces neyagawaensis]
MPDPYPPLADESEPAPAGAEDHRLDAAQDTTVTEAPRGHLPYFDRSALKDTGGQGASGRAEPDGTRGRDR